MMKTTFIATDMDGTLLHEGRGISKENISAVNEALDAGIPVAVATGRDYTEAIGPLKDAGLRLPLICVNGADIRNEYGGIIHQQTLSRNEYEIMNKILTEEEIYFEIYTTKGSFTNNEQKGLDLVVDLLLSTGDFSSYDQAMQLAEKRFEEGAVNRAVSYENVLKDPDTELFKILAFSKDDRKKARARERLANELDVSVSSSAKDNLEITHTAATKGEGLRVMAEYLNKDLAGAMAIGDNFNDLPMMEKAGHAVAMGNAEDAVKKACHTVTGKNTEHGVATAIRSIIPELQK